MTRLLFVIALFLAWPALGDAPIRLASLELVGVDETKPAAPEEEPEPVVTYVLPLTTGGEGVEGRTLEELVTGSPLFAPIENLPEALWKDKQCSSCHQWSREDLCAHGRRYVDGALEAALSKPHPYGGGFKRNIFFWAKNACR